MVIKRGQLVEFTERTHFDYTLRDPKLARYGVATEDESNHIVTLMLADRSVVKVPSNRVYAFGWGGWMPEELEAIWAEFNPEPFGDEFDEY